MEHNSSDDEFRAIVNTTEMRAVDAAGDRERVLRDIRRIASTLFCSRIDPSIVDFAKNRTAMHWGLDEDAIDVMIAGRLLQKTCGLMADLR
jgi:hypothetical protein